MTEAWRRPLVLWALLLVLLGVAATFVRDDPPSSVQLDVAGADTATGATGQPSTKLTTQPTSVPPTEPSTTSEAPTTTVPAAATPPPAATGPAEEPEHCVPGTFERGSCQQRPWVLTGRLADAAGNPAAGICIEAMRGDVVATTAADGTYRVEVSDPTNPPWLLRDCSDDAFGWIEQFVAARYAGGQTTTYDVTLTRLSGVRGRVVDVNGDPVAGVCVSTSVADHAPPAEPTGVDGRFRRSGVIPGRGGIGVAACPQQALYPGGVEHTFTPGQWTEVTIVVLLPGQVPPPGFLPTTG